MEATALTTSGAASAVSTAEQARIAAALDASCPANTTRAYRSGWAAWQRWAAEHGHQIMPAASVAVAAYLTHRAEQGASVATVRMARAAISAAHRQGAADPCKHPGVVQVLKGLSRTGKGRGRGQVQGLDWRAADLAAGVAANGGRSLAGLRDAAIIRSCRMRCCGSAKRQRWTWPTCNARSTASAPSRCEAQKPTRKGTGTCATLARLPFSDWQRGSAPLVSPPAGRLFRQVLKDGATVTGRLGARSIRSIITRRAADAGVAGRVSGHSLRVGSAQSLAAAGTGLVELQEAGDWQAPTMPAHYARHQLAARGAVAKLRYQAGR